MADGFELAREVLGPMCAQGSGADAPALPAATVAPIAPAAPGQPIAPYGGPISAEAAERIARQTRAIEAVWEPPPRHDDWADYEAGRLPSCVEELTPHLRQRELRRQRRDRDGS